jgi:hypothetical protein
MGFALGAIEFLGLDRPFGPRVPETTLIVDECTDSFATEPKLAANAGVFFECDMDFPG